MNAVQVFLKLPFAGLRDANHWLRDVRRSIPDENDLHKIVEIASFYPDGFGAFSRLKRAYREHNRKLCDNRDHVCNGFLQSEREFCGLRRRAGVRRTLHLLESALDERVVPICLSVHIGRPDIIAGQELRYQGSWSGAL